MTNLTRVSAESFKKEMNEPMFILRNFKVIHKGKEMKLPQDMGESNDYYTVGMIAYPKGFGGLKVLDETTEFYL